MSKIAIIFIDFYQKIKKTLIKQGILSGNRVCRFYPTCSQYTKEALQKHGFFKGLFLGVRRVLKCHPFSEHKIDKI
ncbi:membrane protein insertion efficiency factor YidD [Candidatus Nomurabacteria bacterium]|nr:membrane protein insertion efficiency factor YidD [Candidatus Nomurabacteria bacterium]USN94668.1 MAG: membrane protein insertion efficiency factor YidD [Candidatus Nomurabacteria bacterium]